MSTVLRHIVFFLAFITTVQHVTAQDAAKELQEISAHYTSYTQFATDFSYLLYDDISRRRLVEKQEGMLVQSGANAYMRALNTETLKTGKVNIVVNHDRKIMLVSKPDQQDKQPDELLFLNGLDSLLQAKGKLKVRSLNKHANFITILYDAGEVRATSIVYDPGTYLISEVHLLFSDTHGVNGLDKTKQPLLVMKYQHTKVNGEVDNRYFREEKFIQRLNGKIVPVQTYNSYQLISQ